MRICLYHALKTPRTPLAAFYTGPSPAPRAFSRRRAMQGGVVLAKYCGLVLTTLKYNPQYLARPLSCSLLGWAWAFENNCLVDLCVNATVLATLVIMHLQDLLDV